MEQINILLDLILIAAAVWMIFVIKGTDGVVGKAFSLIAWGVILLGLAHVIETITFEVLHLHIALVELLHRLIVLAGFVVLILGFKKITAIR